MNVTCPHCRSVYRVDPRKVPGRGVRARCASCTGVFAVTRETGSTAAPPPPAPDAAPAPVPSPPPVPDAPAEAFGAPDPHQRARRLARALVSDMVAYHPERRERSLSAGTLRQEFRDEIRKSWDEYVGQVGEELAHATPYFRDALNEILAGGSPVF